MTQDSSARGMPRWLRAIFSLVMLGTMGFLATFLFQKCSAGHESIDAYVAAVRSGADVTPEVGGDEAQALTRTLRSSSAITIQNFIGQGGTVCYYVGIEGTSGSVDGRFLLDDDDMRVIGASLDRSCNCPDDEQSPCRIER